MADKVTADIGFEKQIWNAACVLRGNMDASEYKNVGSRDLCRGKQHVRHAGGNDHGHLRPDLRLCLERFLQLDPGGVP